MSHTTTLEAKELTEEIGRYDLNTRDGIRGLENHIRQCWTMGQIIYFHPFLHGGRFMSPAGWERSQSGVQTQTIEEDTALARLFDGLHSECHNYLGAASALEMNGARMSGGYCLAGQNLIDFTLNEMRDKLPAGLRERIEKETKPLEADRDDARNRQGGIDRQIAELKKELAEVKKERDAARAELLKAKGLI